MTDQHDKIKRYLDEMCSQVKAREVHTDLRNELGNHMREMMLDKKQEGFTEEEAAVYAVKQMGDPAAVGKSMHRLHRHRMHWGLICGLISLTIVSLFLMWIFKTNVTDARYQNFYNVQVVYTIIGMTLMSFFIFFDYRKWKRAAWWIYILLNTMLWINPMISSSINGMYRYYNAYGFVLDLTSAAMWVLPLSIGAIMLDKLRSSPNVKTILFYIAMVALPSVLLLQISDWVRLYMFVTMSLVLLGWIMRKWLYTVIGALITGCIGLFLLFIPDPYHRLERILVVFNLQDDPYGDSYIYNSIIEVLGSAGWWGNGLGTTFDRFKTSYFDYPGVLLIDVFGWSAGILLLVGIIWFVASMVKMLPRIRDDFGRMIIVIITSMFALQMIYSLAMTTGRVPILSVVFPFIGYGNHLIFDYAMIGLLLGVYRRKDTVLLKNEKSQSVATPVQR
ncbi:FtsW/RodA/SpoVE family cell cycle protein [Paenibacillus xylanilyticus]|uniref:FtsW/RodA/SpoVE family cell cycle protein n=1 Tax=Paenibacillus xylanilyticus TaxID=248903 RepID=A0A7Y6BX89_9BACL|nr:FtsW/RodA/SpoVE family cell cycle protein [Paenibacillus xylanilyticus]NUU76604.1 FtsW/RodA/SpoVE family cell cycle protein [Paenibacillus xylanilyticus]